MVTTAEKFETEHHGQIDAFLRKLSYTQFLHKQRKRYYAYINNDIAIAIQYSRGRAVELEFQNVKTNMFYRYELSYSSLKQSKSVMEVFECVFNNGKRMVK